MTEDKPDLDYEEIDTDEFHGFRTVDRNTDRILYEMKIRKGIDMDIGIEFWKQVVIPEVGNPEEAVGLLDDMTDDALEELMDGLGIPTGNPFKVDEDDDLT